MFHQFKRFFSVLVCFLIIFCHAPASAAENLIQGTGKGAWLERCNEKAKDKSVKRGRCEIFQRLIEKKSEKRFLELAISYPDGKQQARGVFVLPLAVLLPSGVKMKIDDGKEFKFHVRYCDVNGCFAYIELNDEIISTMRKGKKLTVTFSTLDNNSINTQLTLNEFSQALDKVL